MQTVNAFWKRFFTPFIGYEFKTLTCVFPEDTDFFGRDKAFGNQSKPKKAANPFGIFGVIFVVFHGFDPFWVGNDYVDTVFQKIENRNPVLIGGFHADIKTLIVKQPLLKMADVRIKRRETLFLVRRQDTIC